MLTIKPLHTRDIAAARKLSDNAGWNQLDVDWERLITLWPMTTVGGGWAIGSLPRRRWRSFDALAGNASRLAWIGVMLVDPGVSRGRAWRCDV